VFAALFLALFTLTQAQRLGANPEELFKEFVATYSKNYDTPLEWVHRYEVFRKNLDLAGELDRRSPFATYGITKFMDLTPEEFRAKYLLKDMPTEDNTAPVWSAPEPSDFPTSYDWRSKGVVTPVYNQQQCGSCWAFSTTENIESMWALAGHNLTRLSMQQIVDCDTYDGGCGGGNPPTAYKYVMQAGGLEPYDDYPYVGVGTRCHFVKSKVVANIENWQWVTRDKDETVMQSFVYTTGPASICVDASSWQYYKDGVITKSDGCGTALDHCVQLTGWDEKSSLNAWTVRNSWGADWGNQGYLYVQMGGNVCGIAQEVTSSIVKNATVV
jgi:C1A family cysteine protease